ncbi:pseudaminic acid synthase [Luteolibacter sp. SL250]|uniref:pseudaminic acid synthase n=1 Tax=Luteolibacter sp. SL250 TaxID=2995170 RepID=UPI00226E6CFE|nr:pseudaminic acid synthase [Luteolibacter sp. SL250]WAC20188.1 pseudaminic acid synthase [Luteolibacter sp. SL250]
MSSKRLDFRNLPQTYIIAEISANHNGSIQSALDLIRIAKECGADAVKLQTYTADTLTLDCDNEHFRIGGGTLWDGKTLHQLYQEAHTPWEWHKTLFDAAAALEIDCFSTPFDSTAVDFLEQFNPPCQKVASFELVDHGLLACVARTGRPVILSTGMATFEEIREAVQVLRDNGCQDLALLKCTSAYPAPAEEANLARLPHMAETFGCTVGLSDHTMGIVTPVVAVSLGAKIIEKHICHSRSEPGPDSAFSLEPAEFSAMVEAVRIAEKAVGTPTYERTAKEAAGLAFRRSLFISKPVSAGEIFTDGNIRSVRPGNGLPPKHLPQILGRRAASDLPAGTPLEWAHVSES